MKPMQSPGTNLKITPPFRPVMRRVAGSVGLGARLAGFAGQRLARLERMMPGRSGHANMVFRRASPAAFFQTLQQRLSLSVQPRLTMVYQPVRISRTREAQSAHTPPLPPLVFPALPVPALTPTAAPAWKAQAQTQELADAAPQEVLHSVKTSTRMVLLISARTIDRLLEREKRMDMVRTNPVGAGIFGSSSTLTSPPAAVIQAQPVARVTLARQAVTRHSADEYEEPARTLRQPGQQYPQQPSWGSQQNTVPDINRLADQVVQVIDQRMIAHRERMGRI